MSLKVLHILSGDLWGGAEAQMGLQIRAQRELGLDSRVILFNDGETKRRYLDFGIPLEVVSENSGTFTLFPGSLRSSREFQPEVIVSHGYKETFVAAFISLLSKTPFISTVHGGTESYTGIKALKSFFYSYFSLFLAKNFAKTTIVPTLELQKQLNLKGEVIGNVADISPPTVDLGELRKSIGFEVTQPLIIWVGRIVPVKRIDRAIQAVQSLQKENFRVNLAIVGTGELKERNQQLISSLGLEDRIKFLDFRSDAGALIGSADILLLTSESEGLPTVMAEAMTQGVRLVMSDLPGIKEVAKRFNRYPILLVSPQTPENFAQSIKDTLANQIKISQDELKEVRNWFDPKRAAKEFSDLFLGK